MYLSKRRMVGLLVCLLVMFFQTNAQAFDYWEYGNGGFPSATAAGVATQFCAPGSYVLQDMDPPSLNVVTFNCVNSGGLLYSGGYITTHGTPIPNTDLACKYDQTNHYACSYDPTKITANKNLGLANKDCSCGNPINLTTGNKFQTEVDYAGIVSVGLMMQRTYNSATPRNGRYGVRWTGSYASMILADPAYPAIVAILRDNGKEVVFTNNSSGIYLPDVDIIDTLTRQVDGSGNTTSWQYLIGANQSLESYDANGRLSSIRSRSGMIQTLTYSDTSTSSSIAPQAGLLIRVTDNFGHQLNFTYDSNSRIVQMTDPLGAVTTYSYDTNNNLTSVTYPGGSVRTYVYNESSYTSGANLPTALTGIVDENSNRYATFNFDSSGRAISTEHAGGVEKYSVAYTSGTQTSVTYPLGSVGTYTFQSIVNSIHNTGITQPAGVGSSIANSATTYDTQGNVATNTDFNGVITTYTYDLTRNLETSRVEASGTPQARTISTSWHATYRSPLKIAEPLLLTTFTYDASGNVLTKTSQATTDTTGASGLSPTTTGTARTWTYTYNSVGQVLTVTGPRTDVLDKTTFVYDASGNLSTITNAASQVTTLSNYDANGHVGRVVDPNGTISVLTYSPRGWLTSKVVTAGTSTQTTSYGYDPVGQLTLVTLPDSSTITYTYDAAHRLTNIADSLGNSIAYTLDNMGNRLTEKVQDPSSVLARQTTRVMDALNRLQTITGGVQ